MNSTDFFKKRLLPIGKKYFPPGSEPETSSYFVGRQKTEMTKADFELSGGLTPDTLAETLKEFWRGQGDAEWAALAKPMAALARSVYAIDTQSGDVSPFIYVMY